MKSGFKDPTAIKRQNPKDRSIDGKNSPWNFECPPYDQRSSCFVNAGTHYGEGHRQPVGSKEHNPNGPIPMGRVNTMKVDESG